MDWTSLTGQMLFCLLLAGLLGGVLGWLLKTLLGGHKLAEREADWQVRLNAKERELETMQARSREQLRELDVRLSACGATVRAREAALAEWSGKYAQVQADLDTRAAAQEKFTAELTDWRNKFTQAEAELKDRATAYAGLETELGGLRQSFAGQENELADLTKQLALLAPLQRQIKDGDAEIKRLQLSLSNQEAAQKQALSSVSAKATEWENRYLLLAKERSETESENKKLHARLGELEAANLQSGEWENKCLQLVQERDAARGENEQLHIRISELEITNHKAQDYYHVYLRERDQQLAILQSRLREQEAPRRALSNDGEAKLLNLTTLASTEDTEVRRLQARGSELETAAAHTARSTDLLRVEGIGQVYYERLTQQAGIWTQAELLENGRTAQGRCEIAAKSGIEPTLILRWVNHVDLRRIQGLDEQFAELLKVAGVDTVPELAQRKPENLFQKAVAVNEEKHLSPRVPTEDEIRSWVEQAKALPRVVTH